MAVIRPHPQTPMRTAEGDNPREQLNTPYLINKGKRFFPDGDPMEKSSRGGSGAVV